MPELPDVEVYRQRLVDATRRRRLEGAQVHDQQVLAGTSARALADGPRDARVATTRRHGKTLYALLGTPPHLRLHFGMTGDLVPAGSDDPTPEHTRVVLDLSGGRRLQFVDQRKLGEVGLVDDVDADIAEHGLGPDVLDLDERALRDLLGGSRAGLKAPLTDQQQVAGLGNIYTDEVLFQARLDPRRPAADVSPAGVRRLHRQVRRVVDRAVEAGAERDAMPRGWLLHRREDHAECPRGTARSGRSPSVVGAAAGVRPASRVADDVSPDRCAPGADDSQTCGAVGMSGHVGTRCCVWGSGDFRRRHPADRRLPPRLRRPSEGHDQRDRHRADDEARDLRADRATAIWPRP